MPQHDAIPPSSDRPRSCYMSEWFPRQASAHEVDWKELAATIGTLRLRHAVPGSVELQQASRTTSLSGIVHFQLVTEPPAVDGAAEGR